MAIMNDSTRHEPPLSRREREATVSFCGSREQLVAAGVIGCDDPMPGDPGMRATFARFHPGHPRRIQMIWRQGTRFTVVVLRPQHELDAIARGEQLRRARAEFEEEARRLAARIDSLPNSHDDFRRSRTAAVRALVSAARRLVEPSGGYAFDRDTLDEIGQLVARIGDAVSEGSIRFDENARDAEIEVLRSALRGKDPDFVRFLRDLG
jgi:hypothetical protein